jgi:hypothetical protein
MTDDFENVFQNITDAILHYQYWSRENNFFNCCCINCGIIRYHDLPLDFYLIKKEYHDLLLCGNCFTEIRNQNLKRNMIFEGTKILGYIRGNPELK